MEAKLWNRKPYRSKADKELAKKDARRLNGAYQSSVRIRIHSDKCEPHRCFCRKMLEII